MIQGYHHRLTVAKESPDNNMISGFQFCGGRSSLLKQIGSLSEAKANLL
jgi:hypothetical protein